jgi:chemotaxis protein MotB
MNKKPLDLSAAQSSYQFPYIAVMTIFCIFFMMMYAYYAKLFADTREENKRVVEQVKEDVQSDPELSRATTVELTEDGIKLTLPTAILFGAGSANLKDEVKTVLGKLSSTIKALPGEFKVRIDGHTDDAPVWYGGDYSSNWELSLYRSLSLIDLFVREGNDADRFIASGYGEYRPLHPNDTLEHRAANRRVEIIIEKKEMEMKSLNAA